MLAGARRLAMQYSPNTTSCTSPWSTGTVEFLRGLGKEDVSSADLVSQFEAVLSAEQIASHAVAPARIDVLARRGLEGDGPPPGPIQRQRVRSPNSTWCSGSDEAMRAKAWSGTTAQRQRQCQQLDSHYGPNRERFRPIREGDFVLIDIWGPRDSPAPSSMTSLDRRGGPRAPARAARLRDGAHGRDAPFRRSRAHSPAGRPLRL